MSIAPRRSTFASLMAAFAASPPFGLKQELFTAAGFTYNGGTGLSTRALAVTSLSATKLQGFKALSKGGADVMKRVSGTPAAAGEFSITGSTLTIYGDVTGSGDTYTVRYPTA